VAQRPVAGFESREPRRKTSEETNKSAWMTRPDPQKAEKAFCSEKKDWWGKADGWDHDREEGLMVEISGKQQVRGARKFPDTNAKGDQKQSSQIHLQGKQHKEKGFLGRKARKKHGPNQSTRKEVDGATIAEDTSLSEISREKLMKYTSGHLTRGGGEGNLTDQRNFNLARRTKGGRGGVRGKRKKNNK